MISAKDDRMLGLKIHRMYNRKWNCAIDVGTCDGHFSKLYCKLFNEVIGFDPGTVQKEFANRVSARFSNYTHHNVGLYENQTSLTFHEVINKPGLCSVLEEYQYQFNIRKEEIIKRKISLYPLDHFNYKPDFMKIDVEGVAEEVIIGGKDTIAEYLPTIQIEKGKEDDLMESIGYKCISNESPYSDKVYIHKSIIK